MSSFLFLQFITVNTGCCSFRCKLWWVWLIGSWRSSTASVMIVNFNRKQLLIITRVNTLIKDISCCLNILTCHYLYFVTLATGAACHRGCQRRRCHINSFIGVGGIENMCPSHLILQSHQPGDVAGGSTYQHLSPAAVSTRHWNTMITRFCVLG